MVFIELWLCHGGSGDSWRNFVSGERFLVKVAVEGLFLKMAVVVGIDAVVSGGDGRE